MNRHTFYIDGKNKVHAYDGEYTKSKRKKVYAKRIGRSSFLVSENQYREYIFNFKEMIEYIIMTLDISNEIVLGNLSRAIVGRILMLCNENINFDEHEEEYPLRKQLKKVDRN